MTPAFVIVPLFLLGVAESPEDWVCAAFLILGTVVVVTVLARIAWSEADK